MRLSAEPATKGQLRNNLAWLLATEKQDKLVDPNEAIELALQACRQIGYQNPVLLDTLAAAYAAAGRFAEAVSTAEKALELAKPLGNKELIETINSRLQLYKAGQPYHNVRQIKQH